MSNGTLKMDDVLWNSQCFSEECAYYSLLIVISVFIICINFYVIYTMATNKSLRTKRNAFLASLSVSDLLTGLVSIPLHILSNCYNPPSALLILAQAICFRFVAISTMLNIFMITIERYIGIIYPIKYQFILTKARTSILIICTWATSVSSALISYTWLVSANVGDHDLGPRERQFERAYFVFTFVAFFLLPLVTMIVLYRRMFRAISKARKLASKARTYLKTSGRCQSPAVRSPVAIRVTRPRSVSHGSYGDHHHLRGQSRSGTQSPASTPEKRNRSRSHGSYGDHATLHGTRSQSPARFSPVETLVTHYESDGQICITVSRPQSPAWFQATCGNRISSPENGSAHAHSQPQSPHLSLPLNEATRYAKHHGSYDRFLSNSHRFKSASWLSNSSQMLVNVTKPLEKFLSDSVIGSRERTQRSSIAERLLDACENAASKLRMLRHGSNEDRWGHARIKREHRVLLVFVTMLSVFVFSWISWYILVLDFTYVISVPGVVLDCFDVLRFSVSFVNPLLYTFFKQDFRSAFKKSLRRRSADKPRTKLEMTDKYKKINL